MATIEREPRLGADASATATELPVEARELGATGELPPELSLDGLEALSPEDRDFWMAWFAAC